MNDFLKSAMPWLGAAATGNIPALVAMAASHLSDATGLNVKPSVDAISSALTMATPEQLAQFKQADNDFALKMQSLGFENVEALEKIAAGDRADARSMAVHVDVWTPRVIAGAVMLGYFGVQAFLLTHVVDQSMRELVARILGTLDGALMLVLGFYFGSSAGSRASQNALANNQK